jgi:outer membrane lipase/esterase
MRKNLMAASALWLLAMPVWAQQVGDVVVFGDSLSDPGNIPDLTGGVNFPPSPPYVGNRFSNGPVYTELLPGLLGGAFDPSLNFAVGGALTGPDNLNSNRPSPDPASDLTGIVLPGIEGQVDSFLAGGGALDDEDIVIVYGGANDVFVAADAAATLPADQIPDLITSTATISATNLATSVLRLNAVGGDFFILPNLPDIGATPSFTALGPDGIALGSGFTLAHNLALNQAAVDLQTQTGDNIIVFDVNAILADMQANPLRYGLGNVSEACIDVLQCVAGDRETQDQFLFFDGVHPTAGVHAQVADILATTVRAPTTLAAQGDVVLAAGEGFQRMLIESFSPPSVTASRLLAESGLQMGVDTADNKRPGEAIDRPTDVFAFVRHANGNRDARRGALGYDYDQSSVTLGLRRQATDHVSLGAALRIGGGDVDLEGGRERFEHRQVDLGLSTTLAFEQSYLTGLVNLGYVDIKDIERETSIDEVETNGSTDGLAYGAGLAAGHRFAIGDRLSVSPLASLRYSAVDLEQYIEDGPSFLGQRVDDQDDIESLVASLGAAAALDLGSFGNGMIGNLGLRVSGFLEHDFEDGDRTVTSAFVSGPTTLETSIDGGDQTTGRVGIDISASIFGGIDVGVGYEALIGDDEGEEHAFFGRATISF